MNATPTTTQIADAFVAVLREWLTPDEFEAMRHKNREHRLTGNGCCASHDYCDANMAMVEALESLGLPGDDNRWNAAWDAARPAITAGLRPANPTGQELGRPLVKGRS